MTINKKAETIRFFTTAEIAEMLKMNGQVIARKLQAGEIPGYKIGKDWRVREADLWRWLEGHSNKNQPMGERDKIVGRFMKNGRFETLPVQRKKRRFILEYILEKFDLNEVYTEKEVNTIIKKYHEDYCRIRREFVDEKMMYRGDGKYRRNAGHKTLKQ